MVDILVELDQVGDISTEDMRQILKYFGLRESYECGECGEVKSEKKNVNGKTVSVPHCCPALLARVRKWAENRVMDLSEEEKLMNLKKLEARMKADPEADQSKSPKKRGLSKTPRGPYKCGRCRKPKVKECKCDKAKPRNARPKRRRN